jgi:hypothetical protein
MEHIQQIWKREIEQNPIDNIQLEINLGHRLSQNCISYELSGSVFNEILADIALLKIWNEWKSGTSTKYFLNDMIMILDESGHSRVSINKTLFEEYKELPTNNPQDCNSTPFYGFSYLKNIPQITDIRVHKDDRDADKESEGSCTEGTGPINEPTCSNLHIKCCRRIPLSSMQFPPYNKYHAIERIAYRYYRNANLSINFIISRPRDCLRPFDELLVNWQNSRFMIKIVVMTPCPELAAILKYLGHHH